MATILSRSIDFDGNDVSIVQERHYRLTESKDITEKDLTAYRSEGRVNLSDIVKRVKIQKEKS